jgi:ABC-type amino acid transport substrate-binding protein
MSRRTYSAWAFVCLLLSCAGASAATTAATATAEPMRYVRPQAEGVVDRRLDYYWDLLRAALDVTRSRYGPYELRSHPVLMNAERAAFMLDADQGVTVIARTTSREREKKHLPIRIPLDKGLTGYRLFLIQAQTQGRLDNVRTLSDLAPFSIGQGNNWVDVEILRNAGLTVETGMGYEALFQMLSAGRFDLFSRGVNEIQRELEDGKARNPGLVIEKNLLLYYPLPRYYFFARTPEGEKLAKRVEDGLRELIRSGAFERRYQAFKTATLADLNLSGRRVFRMQNPTLSEETPLDDKRLWDNLTKELKAPR